MIRIFILISFLSTSAFALGTKDSGGDPMAQQFADYGNKLAQFFTANPYNFTLPFDAKKFSEAAQGLQDSLNDENIPDRIEFTTETLRDSSGVEKPAVFNTEGKIRVNRAAWVTENTEERLIQVGLEIAGLIGVPARYETILRMVKSHTAMIEAAPLKKPGERYELKGWRMVGQDAGQFAEITQLSHIIDLGTLTSGSASIVNFFQFLKDPQSQPELFLAMVKAWNEGHPAYFLLHSPEGNRASITMIAGRRQDSEVYLQAYSLYFKKVTPVYSGDCSGNAPDLNSLERLQRCYLDQNLYAASEGLVTAPYKEEDAATYDAALRSVFADWLEEMTKVYAQNPDAMTLALRNAFVHDYSPISLWGSEQRPLLVAGVAANGLKPDLIYPSTLAPFWRQTTEKDPKAIRLYQAAKTIAQNQLVYINRNYFCSPDSRFPNGLRGEALVERDKARETVAAGGCSYYSMGLGSVDERLFDLLVEIGYYYDPKTSTWMTKGTQP